MIVDTQDIIDELILRLANLEKVITMLTTQGSIDTAFGARIAMESLKEWLEGDIVEGDFEEIKKIIN